MTMTFSEIEILEHLDFEHEPPCENSECDATAEWKIVIRCCSRVVLACGPCLENDRNLLERLAVINHTVDCQKCHTHGLDPRTFIGEVVRL